MINFDLTQQGVKRIHFIGIGGISMSAIAEALLSWNYQISGSDMHASKFTQKLAHKGAKIYIGHSADNIQNYDLVVYTAAVKEDNPELLRARELGIPVIDRATMMGLLMKKYNCSIGVSGTHGKTTTTSMISLILQHGDFNPTIMVGGELDELGGNVKIGGGDYFVTEACEYVESFLKFFPKMGVVLNIDADHLDYFHDINHIISAFKKYIQLIPPEGYLIAFSGDPNVLELLPDALCKVITYGVDEESDYRGRNISYNDMGFPSFDVYHHHEFLGRFQLHIPGYHNVCNALAAIASTHTLGVPVERIAEKLAVFKGTHRRFDILGKENGITVVDDYAHHPTEVAATLDAAKHYPHHKIWCVFQPHTYTRTKALLHEFSQSFRHADQVIITDIYAAREKDTGEIHSRDLADALHRQQGNALYFNHFDQIVSYLSDHTSSGDLVLTMGAGDIYKVGEMLLETLREKVRV